MSGTISGGKLAARTNIQRHGPNFYAMIGTKGGLAKKTKPFGFQAMTLEQRRAAGSKGGSVSRKR